MLFALYCLLVILPLVGLLLFGAALFDGAMLFVDAVYA